MPREPIPDELRRFILTSVPSVPFVEALLLFMAPPRGWIATSAIARQLYVSPAVAADVVAALRDAQSVVGQEGSDELHRFAPATPQLASTLEQLVSFYTRDLIGVTELIHARTARRAQQFADAFKLRKDS